MASSRTDDGVCSWLAPGCDRRAPGSRDSRSDSQSADYGSSSAYEVFDRFCILALLGVDPLAGAPLALLQLCRNSEHPRFGAVPAAHPITLVSAGLGGPICADRRPERKKTLRQRSKR